MSFFGYRRELSKYEDVDEDELLASLSPEELAELEKELVDIDPDANVPIGLRQKDQTDKTPTGTFSREALMKYWENETQRILEDEIAGGSPKPDFGALNSAPMLLRPQRAEPIRLTPPPPPADPNATGNPTVVDEALQQALNNSPELTEVNLNNIEDISQETLIRFAEALRSNTHVRVFSLANTHADDPAALAIAKMLRENSSITSLNIESNYVTGKGVMALVQALPGNNTLTELRFHNQRHMCGGQVEMEMVKILRENNTLIKLGYQFNLPGPRMSMTGILTRNQDRQRQKRLQEQRLQQQGAPEGAGYPRTNALKGTSSPYSSPRASPWSSPKLNRSDLELKNALRPVMVERRGEEGSRPSTPMRSAHDQLMESIRNRTGGSLKRVEIQHHLL
ncbi:Leiomodin-2 [Dissostichus eleginoides]|uniref:Leiomodin-2 n=1 Tax=Dissostichus eleginoides TaxID=100907 RepID=A0AAD9FPG2_DISEL|nr:Leiomodin-2 [Dissostichus eleginoides]